MEYQTSVKPKDTLTIASNLGNEKIKKKKIVSCKNFSFGTMIYLKDNTHYLLKVEIPKLETILDGDEFFVIDNRTMINIFYIESIFQRCVGMKNGEEYDLGPKARKALFRRIEKLYEVYNSGS